MPVFEFELPDGKVVEIDAPNQEAASKGLRNMLQGSSPGVTPQVSRNPLAAALRQQPGLGEAVARGAGSQFLGNLAAIPNQLVNLPFLPTGVSNLQSQFRGEPPAFRLPVPTGEQAVAGLETAAEIPGAIGRGEPLNLPQRFAGNIQQGQQAAQQHPIGTAAGELLGDAATLATGRVPFARTATARFLRGQTQAELAFGRAVQSLEPSTRRAFDRFVHSDAMQKLTRGAGRSVEAGFEGATLATLRDGDPLQTAAFAAGGQAVGSVLISGTSLRGGALKLAGRAAGLTALIQVTKSALPGGRDRILESSEEAFDSLKLALLLGVAARGVGAGRLSGRYAEDLPEVADAISALPRGVSIGILNDALSDDTGTTERALQHLSVNPIAFTESQRQTLTRSIDAGKFGETVKRLAESDEQFSEIIDSQPRPPSAQQILSEAVSADNREFTFPSGARTADAVARRLPRQWRDRLEGTGPREFVSTVFNDERGAAVLPKLGTTIKNDALELVLTHLVTRSSRRDGSRLVLDADDLKRRWRSLPEPVRKAYQQRDTIEAFIRDAQTEPVTVLPPALAHSLMLPDGRLSRELRGKAE